MVLGVWVWVLACGGAPAPVVVHEPHFDEWERLVRLGVTGQRDAVRTVARTLEGPDDARVGGALGFLQVADVEDVPFGLVRLAGACGDCHRAKKVSAPSPAHPSHPEEGARALHARVWGAEGPDAPILAALQDCSRCHGTETR